MKLKIVNKKRFMVCIIILIILVITILSKFNFENNKFENYETEEYVVQAGDTLWSIASENVSNNIDIREYIYELREINNLDDCLIYPGQVINIIK